MLLLPGVAGLTAGLLSTVAASLQLLRAARRPAPLEENSPHRCYGQMTEAGQWSFTYNHVEQIKTAEKTGVNATYTYDGNGLRVHKRVSSSSGIESTDYLWAGAEVLKEYTGMGAAKAIYLLGAGREGIKTDQGWQFYLRDALGSTVMTTDASGEIASQFEYGDWGETSQVFGSTSQYNPYRYTGQQFDGETGLYYLRARSYAPELGRFTSRDPIGYAADFNLYSYCGGDPLNWTDPSGLDQNNLSPQLRTDLINYLQKPVDRSRNPQYTNNSAGFYSFESGERASEQFEAVQAPGAFNVFSHGRHPQSVEPEVPLADPMAPFNYPIPDNSNVTPANRYTFELVNTLREKLANVSTDVPIFLNSCWAGTARDPNSSDTPASKIARELGRPVIAAQDTNILQTSRGPALNLPGGKWTVSYPNGTSDVLLQRP